jgi:hypothetical protein
MNATPIDGATKPCGLCGMPWPYAGCDCGNSITIEQLQKRIAELEAQLSEATKPPPCKHERRSGWTNGSESDEWCNDCGANTKTIKAVSGVANFAICEGMRNIAVQRGLAGCQHEWRGPGEMPGRYTCGCGTVVFRSREDAD